MTKSRTRTETDDLIAGLDAADSLPGARELRELSYELLGDVSSVVDVGCGAGRAVAELTDRGVEAVGVDPDERMIAIARTRWPHADFRRADAYALPLPDHSTQGCRADKVFHELADPARALAEARRVLVPGGRVVLVGQDWDTLVIDSDDPSFTRAIVQARADLVTAPRAARAYRNLLLDAGFEDVEVEIRTAVLTGPETLPLLVGLAEASADRGRADDWIAGQRARAERDRLFLALPMFVASATSPYRTVPTSTPA
ncbi:methyltransferase domain-containing protein [Streptomyces fulvoviolaceus]|uniref:methyltransferase domain-containing protein n=1 Tax=Streptomyces fulvoviolaceus TaxID=285535 RepID=UPI0004C55979|nr:methyltransferase domain-containing protein [Streptomyces fulvoviolaceus]MCT9078732.1 methyltransferase domain-containing protein [Streptomyces fulvoviolaceus]